MKRAFVGVFAVVTALLLAACSSGNQATGSSGAGAPALGTAAGSAAVATAKAELAKYVAVQQPISIPPLAKPIPTNVSLAILTCANQPSCQAETDGAATAAEKLGWSVKQYQAALTPQGYQAAWTSLMQGNPQAIIYSAIFPDANVASILADVKARHIPTVSISPYTNDVAGSRPRPDRLSRASSGRRCTSRTAS